jgi:hypothetical protein
VELLRGITKSNSRSETMINITEVKDAVKVEKEQTMTKQEMMELVMKLEAEAAELRKQPKNKVAGKPGKNKYVLLTKQFQAWGKVPQQQADIAAILTQNMEVGKEYGEAEVFSMLVDGSGDYPSLSRSVQDPTYLFRYYRGLKNDGKHAGLIARKLLVVK